MRELRSALGPIAAILAVSLLPSAAGAESYVPPSNSAATQYTEAIPTAGGHSDTKKAAKKQSRTPKQVLGGHHAKQLEEEGEAGREAAEFAAATAPAEEAPQERNEQPREAGQSSGGNGGAQSQHRKQSRAPAAAEGGNEGGGGSSGLGEIAGQAVGSSSGGIGWLLPLAVLGAIAWAVVFFMRQRKRPTP